mmetsp:Transcript_33929/g.59143  ORF Transcript_33929/g.59143 Transcript_33929/m.59143 type:complete len:111 (-) Transcript_33929:1605-1937(-)
MATQEAALKAEVNRVANTEELQFALRSYPFVSNFWCKSQPLPQKCTNQGHDLFLKFHHNLKMAKTRAEQCMGACKEDDCYKACLDTLSEKVKVLYEPLSPLLEDYLSTRQ